MNTRRTPSEVSSWKKAALMAAMTVALAACGGGGGGGGGGSSTPANPTVPVEAGYAEAIARLNACPTATSEAPGIQACTVGTYKGKDLVNGTACSVTIGSDNKVTYVTPNRAISFTTENAPFFYTKVSTGSDDFPVFRMRLDGAQNSGDRLHLSTNFDHRSTGVNHMIDIEVTQAALGDIQEFTATCRLSEK